jgi:predicted peptidase
MQSPSYETRLIALTIAVTTVNTWLILNLSEPNPSSGHKYQVSWRAFRLFQPVETTEDTGLAARLMSPHSNVRKQPLVVFLHGAGERGHDNLRQLQNLPEQLALPTFRKRFPCFVLAPQCPSGSYWSQHMDELETLIERVADEHPVDRSRIYLTGLSMGGFGSWELAARRPDLFAAVIPICGGGDPEWASQLSDVPIWAVHGDADEAVSVDYTRTMIAAIED